MTVPAVESDLSRARLSLLDKRKELRETVHEHFRDLVAVSDHAVHMNEKSEALCNSFSRISTLSRALRVRAATARLSGDSPSNRADHGTTHSQPAPLHVVDGILSLNGRILSHITRFEFKAVAEILDRSLPALQKQVSEVELSGESAALCEPHLESFASLNQRVTRYCLQAIETESLRSFEPFIDCLKLLEAVSSSGLSDHFWKRRASAISRLTSVSDMMLLYDLTMAAAASLSLPVDSAFKECFGSAEGHICRSLYSDLHKADAHSILERFRDLQQSLIEFRSSNKYEISVDDISVNLLLKTRELVQGSVRRAIAETNIVLDRIDIPLLEVSLNSLTESIAKFDSIFDREDVLKMVGKELDSKLSSLALKIDRSKSLAVSCGELVAAITGSPKCGAAGKESVSDCPCLKSLGPFLSVSFEQLRSLEAESFALVMDEVAVGTSIRCQEAKLIDASDARNSILNYATTQNNQVEIPCHISPFVFSIIFDICVEIVSLPVPSHPAATGRAKSSLSRFFTSHFSAPSSLSLQTLFDVHAVILLTSSIEEDPDHENLATHVLELVQQAVLTETVDIVLYKDLIRRSAVACVAKNTLIFRPLLSANPAATLLKTVDSAEFAEGAISRSLVANGDSHIDRFNTLPVSRSLRADTSRTLITGVPVAQSAGTQGAAPAFNLSSFFNQVGKITLGGK